MNDLVLGGCRPVPLAHYLKALGVLRLVAEQKDPGARGSWQRDRFVLRTTLTRGQLEEFFLEEYQPTPIVAPWNGGSGFYPKDKDMALQHILESSATRFASYQATIEAGRRVLKQLDVTKKVTSEQKAIVLESCRGELPDEALDWLDAVYVLSNDGAKYPPLLGTGGNDGRLEFTNNFMQRLVALLDAESGAPLPQSASLLQAALFEVPTNELTKGAPIGQFLPENAGGANGVTGFSADSLINSWDFVLMLEGACLFAAATVRRMVSETAGELSAPFTVRSVGTGYGSSSEADEDGKNTRGELWLPLWRRSTTANEITKLFAEGRVRLGARPVRNGVDFARAIASLGIDRGLEGFERYGFQVRNGLAYFAVPLGRFTVRAEPRAGLLMQIDGWLDEFRRRATSANAPASASRALRHLEGAIFALCAHGDALRVQQVLVALGRCERAMVSSWRWTEDNHLRPIPALDPSWLDEADDGSVEYRLAASLASVGGWFGVDKSARYVAVRAQFEPVRTWKSDEGLHVAWKSEAGRDVAWSSGHLADGLNDVLARRLLMATQSGTATYPDTGFPKAALGDIADFIEERVDDQRLTDLLHGLLLLDWTRVKPQHLPRRRREARRPLPAAFYSLLKLCFSGPTLRAESDSAGLFVESEAVERIPIPVVPRIQRLSASGQAPAAVEAALRRLRGSGLVPALRDCAVPRVAAIRSSAALLYPLSEADRVLLRRTLLRPEDAEATGENEAFHTTDARSKSADISTQEA